MSLSMAKQTWMHGESSGGSGEAPVRFKVVSEESSAAVNVARPPHIRGLGRCLNPTWARTCLGVPGSDVVFLMFAVHGAAAVLRQEILHGSGSFDMVQ